MPVKSWTISVPSSPKKRKGKSESDALKHKRSRKHYLLLIKLNYVAFHNSITVRSAVEYVYDRQDWYQILGKNNILKSIELNVFPHTTSICTSLKFPALSWLSIIFLLSRIDVFLSTIIRALRDETLHATWILSGSVIAVSSQNGMVPNFWPPPCTVLYYFILWNIIIKKP